MILEKLLVRATAARNCNTGSTYWNFITFGIQPEGFSDRYTGHELPCVNRTITLNTLRVFLKTGEKSTVLRRSRRESDIYVIGIAEIALETKRLVPA